MQRREFITLIGGAAASWPFGAHAQQSAVPGVGFLSSLSPAYSERYAPGFREGLSEAGYREHQNVVIEYRSANGDIQRLPALAEDLVRRRVNVIVTVTFPAALAAKAAKLSNSQLVSFLKSIRGESLVSPLAVLTAVERERLGDAALPLLDCAGGAGEAGAPPVASVSVMARCLRCRH
jgi:hypothetical protein